MTNCYLDLDLSKLEPALCTSSQLPFLKSSFNLLPLFQKIQSGHGIANGLTYGLGCSLFLLAVFHGPSFTRVNPIRKFLLCLHVTFIINKEHDIRALAKCKPYVQLLYQKSVQSSSQCHSMNDVNIIASREANNSTTDAATEQKYMSRLLIWEDDIVGTYLGFICIMALTLNSLVIYTCLKNWKCLLMSDYYVLNLACSDVLLPMTAFPLPISSAYSHRWMYGDTGCVAYGFLGFFFGLVSITTLTTMGLTRYVSVCHPGKGSSNLSSTKVAIVFSYIYAFIWSTIPLSGWGSYSSESYGISCTLQWNENRVFITLMCVFCISTPSAIMFFSYTMILLKCRQSNSNMRLWQSRNSKLTRKEAYLIKITFAMCWGFLICWMPYAIVSLWTAYGNAAYLPIRLTVVAVLLAKSSTVVNPIIYFLMSNKFRPLLLRSLKLDSGQQQRQIKETKQLKSCVELREKRSPGYSTTVSSKSTSSIERLMNHVATFNFSVDTEDVAL